MCSMLWSSDVLSGVRDGSVIGSLEVLAVWGSLMEEQGNLESFSLRQQIKFMKGISTYNIKI